MKHQVGQVHGQHPMDSRYVLVMLVPSLLLTVAAAVERDEAAGALPQPYVRAFRLLAMSVVRRQYGLVVGVPGSSVVALDARLRRAHRSPRRRRNPR